MDLTVAALGGPVLTRASRQTSGPAPQFTPTASAPPFVRRSARNLRSRAVVARQILAECHLGESGQVAGPADLFEGQEKRLDPVEGLDDEQVDAAFQKAFDLLAEGRRAMPGWGRGIDRWGRAAR